ncbi:hypothetical protein V6N12_054338 [Hibiscus sabdariffa]|uniref:Uncharacterized protein n=1 Tax=Hibiscus sabdariffa TaxID=183260 RepID=A0ABR2D0Y3_9ROSI
MEFPFITIPIITLVFLFMVTRIVSKTKPKNSVVKNLPPGPRKLPLIGNMHQLVSSLPHRTLRDLADKYGALMQLQLGQVTTIVVSSAEIAKEIMKTHDLIFSQRPHVLAAQIMAYNSTAIIFTPYGNYWRQMRKICMMELLSPSRVQSFRSVREEEVSDLIESLYTNAGSPVNLSQKIYSMTYGITARSAFGKKSKEQEEFIRIMAELVKLAGGFCLSDMYPSSELLKLISGMRVKLNKLHQASDKILENIVNEHRDKRNQTGGCNPQQEDLVDILLKIQQQGDLEFPLTNDNIKAVIQDVFGAGSETSATVVEWAMSELLKNPEVLKKAQSEVRQVFGDQKGVAVNESRIHELRFLKSVVKETLRLHPPGPLLVPRECSEDCKIKGYEIPAKTKVIINAWAIGRDPSYWKEAERFDPERFMDSAIDFRGSNFEYIPFGGGRRICPGITYALPSIELPLANLLFHFDWELPGGLKGEDLDMTESFALAVRRKNDLYLIPTPFHV